MNIKKIKCLIGIHSWKIKKSMKVSNLVFIIKRHHPILKNVYINHRPELLIKNIQCSICKKSINEIDMAREILENRMLRMIKVKKN